MSEFSRKCCPRILAGIMNLLAFELALLALWVPLALKPLGVAAVRADQEVFQFALAWRLALQDLEIFPFASTAFTLLIERCGRSLVLRQYRLSCYRFPMVSFL